MAVVANCNEGRSRATKNNCESLPPSYSSLDLTRGANRNKRRTEETRTRRERTVEDQVCCFIAHCLITVLDFCILLCESI